MPIRVRSYKIRVAVGVALAMVLGLLTTSACVVVPILLDRRPGRSLAVTGNESFSTNGQDYWVQRFSLPGYERWDTTPMRGIMAVNKPGTPEQNARGAEYYALDTEVLGPFEGDPFKRHGITIQIHQAGWPWRTVRAVTVHTWPDGRTPTLKLVRGAIPAFGSMNMFATNTRPALIPYWPIWPAFLITLVAWTALWAGLVTVGPFAIRQWSRRRRHACMSCGYLLDRNSLNRVCPECGAAW